MSYTGTAVLHWDMAPESDAAGYRIYVGSASRQYGAPVDVGIITCSTGQPGATISGVLNGVTTYAAVTAYDQTGNESTFSAEVTMVKTVPLLTLLRQIK